MNENHAEMSGTVRLGLPVAVAQHPAIVSRIHQDFHGVRLKREGRARQKVSNNGLQMTVGEAEMRPKIGKPGGNIHNLLRCLIVRGHSTSV